MKCLPLRLVAVLLAPLLVFAATTCAKADEARAELEGKLLGNWEGGPCMGVLQFNKDGTFERRHYSPGGNEVSGTWKLTLNALPPTLTLTVTTSDAPSAFPPGKVWELKVVRLDGDKLSYQYPETEGSSTYRRQTLEEEAIELLGNYVIHAKLTQSIGTFSSFGIPRAGDTFKLDLVNLPQDKLTLTTPGKEERPSYIPFSSPPRVVSVKQGPRDQKPRRTVIDLATPDTGRDLRIRITADGTTAGSKVRLVLYRPGDFLGSMAEADGELK